MCNAVIIRRFLSYFLECYMHWYTRIAGKVHPRKLTREMLLCPGCCSTSSMYKKKGNMYPPPPEKYFPQVSNPLHGGTRTFPCPVKTWDCTQTKPTKHEPCSLLCYNVHDTERYHRKHTTLYLSLQTHGIVYNNQNPTLLKLIYVSHLFVTAYITFRVFFS